VLRRGEQAGAFHLAAERVGEVGEQTRDKVGIVDEFSPDRTSQTRTAGLLEASGNVQSRTFRKRFTSMTLAGGFAARWTVGEPTRCNSYGAIWSATRTSPMPKPLSGRPNAMPTISAALGFHRSIASRTASVDAPGLLEPISHMSNATS